MEHNATDPPPATVPNVTEPETSGPPGEVKPRKKKSVQKYEEIVDEFDFSYIPDSLKDLICGPETAAAAEQGDEWGNVESKKTKIKRHHGVEGEEDEDGEDEDDYDDMEEDDDGEEEEEGTSESDLTDVDDFAPRRSEDDDDDDWNGSEGEEKRRRRRFLLGSHSFCELEDPGLKDALLPKEIPPEKVRTGKKLEKQKYVDLCKSLGIQPLRKFMKNMNKETMDLSRYQLSPDEITAVCKMLENNTKVKYLDLSGNMGSLEGGEAIANMIENNYTITHLNISYTDILPAFKKICDAISLNIKLEWLDLSRNELGDKEMQWVSHFLKESSTLRELYLSRNKIRDQGANYLGQELQHNTSLQVLDLAINEIKGEKRATPLFHGVADHPALMKINLMNNSLKDNAAKGVWRILTNNKQMEFVNVAWNLFDNLGAKTLGNGLRKSQALTEFIVGPNEWRQDGGALVLNPLTNPKNEIPLELIDFGWLFDVYNHFLRVEERVMKVRPNLKIIRGNAFTQWKAKGPDVKALVIRRAKIVCENFATPLEMLIDELRTEEKKMMTHKEFRKFIKSCNLYKDKSLTDAFINVFAHGSFEVDGEAIIAAYDKEYPKKVENLQAELERERTTHSIHDIRVMGREKDKSMQLIKW